MASTKTKNKIKKQIKNAAKKKPGLFIALVIVLILIIGAIYYLWSYTEILNPLKEKIFPNTTEVSKKNASGTVENMGNYELKEAYVFNDLQIYFLELGNEYTGDSTYIKAGETDILIDAGSRQSSAEAIIELVNEHCTDGKLEYVISTHAHQDHIAGMIGNKKDKNNKNPKNYNGETVERTGILYYYQIDTLIDFSRSDATSELYENYQTGVEYAVSKGAKHYTADECFNNEGDAQSTYILSSTANITMDILYNKYYFESASKTEGGENNYSVCTMFNYNDFHFLLTGDLEEEGEEAMSDYYDGTTSEKTLPQVVLFKAGHHGSKTSSNECLLSKIKPQICCVCCCAGSTEYTPDYNNIFPTQDFITRIANYTDKVYVTSMYDETEKTFKSMNGTITVSSDGESIGLDASNNLTKLKDTIWFNEKIYIIDDKIVPKKGSDEFYTKDSEGAIEKTRRIWP